MKVQLTMEAKYQNLDMISVLISRYKSIHCCRALVTRQLNFLDLFCGSSGDCGDKLLKRQSAQC